MRKLLLVLSITCFVLTAVAQDFKKEFSALQSKKDTAAQIALLRKWEQHDPNDAALFVAYFNYYYAKSRSEIVNLGREQKGTPGFTLTDSIGNVAGFLSGGTAYDPVMLATAFRYIDSGISHYPTRLDMRFGKIYVYGQVEDYERFTAGIIQTIHFGQTIGNRWTWADNKPVKDPERFFLQTIQEYVVQLYNAGDAQLDRMKNIALAVLQYYPAHVESLSNLAIAYSLLGDDDKALDALLRAEKIAPEDFIVLNNIAGLYESKGDKPKAIDYYERMLKHGDDEAKAKATEKLKELRK
ncbi:MAG: hypothetical protein ABW019_03105 [Chitinophagaceae bacterium]